MAREARKLSNSGNYYIELNGRELFITDDDKNRFVEILEKNFATGVIHGYELTKTEIRLVVKEGEKGISMTMKPVTTSYARYFNRVHEREGKLFAGRFKSDPLETTSEIEECINNLKRQKPKKKTVKRMAENVKRTAVPEKNQSVKQTSIAQKERETQPAKKNRDLPPWLL